MVPYDPPYSAPYVLATQVVLFYRVFLCCMDHSFSVETLELRILASLLVVELNEYVCGLHQASQYNITLSSELLCHDDCSTVVIAFMGKCGVRDLDPSDAYCTRSADRVGYVPVQVPGP